MMLSAFQIIYSANSDVIGANPGLISVGMRLDFPCLSDTVASTAAPLTAEIVIDRLSGDSQFRCNNYMWSDPMFEQIVGYYTKAGVTYETYDDMMGAHICRPAGYATIMLKENGLVEPNITFTQPTDPAECVRGLADGTFDVFVIANDVADGVILTEGLTDQISNMEALGQVLNLGAVISVNHPQRDEILDVFNAGLSEIKESGEWARFFWACGHSGLAACDNRATLVQQ